MAGRRMLIIEDEPIMRRNITAVFKRLGFDCESVPSILGARDRIDQDFWPDLIIMDTTIPFERNEVPIFIKEMKTKDPDLLLIVYSGWEASGLFETLFDDGFINAWVKKTAISADKLIEVVNKLRRG